MWTHERLKKIWDTGFPQKIPYSAKGRRNNESGLKKEKKESRDLQNPPQIYEEPNIKEKIKWDNEKKVKQVQLEE